MKSTVSFWYRNSLSLVLLSVFLIALIGQIYTGLIEHNRELTEKNAPLLTLGEYLASGHFFQTTFENWESEFLQMAAYVMLTIHLRQVGSSESKHLSKKEAVDREPDPRRRNAPWPVKKGGWYLALYKNSLSLAFCFLFLVSFYLHACGSLKDYNEQQILDNKETVSFGEYLSHSRLWFESFQNWQSEFIAVLSIVVLSIYLRQKGSPESKPVDASHSETGEQ